MSILCLVYLVFFYSSIFAQSKNDYEFEPYKSDQKYKIEDNTKSNEAGKKYLNDSDNMKNLEKSIKAMTEVEELFNSLDTSIKNLADIKVTNEADEEAILKAFAELDGVLSYAYIQLKSAKEQLSSIKPINQEEISLYNSLKVKFMSYMKLANELKRIIATKLANASKRIKK